MNVVIVGRGQVACPWCDPTGKKGKLRAGVAIQLDDNVQRVCNKHLLSVISTHVEALETPKPT